jgi:type I restriction enzyme R subunit
METEIVFMMEQVKSGKQSFYETWFQEAHFPRGPADDPNALDDTEAMRIAFYKQVATYVRAFAAIAQDLEEAGYSVAEIAELNQEVAFFSEVRAAIKRHSGEELDIKPFEADMRHLINTYIQADPADPLGAVDNYSLVELIVETGMHDAIARKLNEKGKLSKNAIAEGIINNVRKTIIREQLTDPRFYQQISTLLDDLIRQWRDETVSYEAFLQKAEALVKKMAKGHGSESVPAELVDRRGALVIYNNLPDILAASRPAHEVRESAPDEDQRRLTMTLAIDRAMREQAPAGWKGDAARESQVLNALFLIMGRDREATRAVFELIKNQVGY